MVIFFRSSKVYVNRNGGGISNRVINIDSIPIRPSTKRGKYQNRYEVPSLEKNS